MDFDQYPEFLADYNVFEGLFGYFDQDGAVCPKCGSVALVMEFGADPLEYITCLDCKHREPVYE